MGNTFRRNKVQENSAGSGLLSLLGVLFIGLKLTGYIDWSWWWVTAPFWGPLAVLGSIWLIAVAGLAVLDR